MDAYAAWLRDVLRLAGEIYFRRVEAELQKFSEALEQWMHALLAHPRPDWRESLDRLLAQQEAEGRGIDSKSRQALVDYLERWAETVDWSAVDGRRKRDDRAVAVDDAAPASNAEKPVPLPKNWPALTPSEAEAAQRSTGLPWWYPLQPKNRTDSLWQKKLASVGQVARDRLLAFYREVAVLGHLSRTIEDPEQFDVESLLAQRKKIQEAYDGYIRAKRDVYYEWTRYLSMEWFIGPEVFAVFRKVDNGLPDQVAGFDSPHDASLKAQRHASFEATNKKMRRTDAAYTALVWTDNVIAVIEIITLVGSAKAVFTQTAKRMAAKGLSKAAARSAAVAYSVAHLGTAAASAVVIGGFVPRVLVNAGLDEADVRAGLVVFRAFFTVVGLRAVVKPRPGRSPAEHKATKDYLRHIRMREGKAVEVGRAYPHSQVYVRKPTGKGYWILDGYDPDAREIVSFKDTQLADVKLTTATGYLNELRRKYPPGRIIADVPSSDPALVGKRLQGQMILEVPVQKQPIPEAVLKAAKQRDIRIRDVGRRTY